MSDALKLRIDVVRGDITTLDVDAIVNAANQSLLGGGGVDGAIHRAAGPELLAECRTLGGCPAGAARLTHGYRLPAGHVIHTVGPFWNGGGRGEVKTLESCYRASLELCADHDIHSVAFPCIATGVYRFPKNRACDIAVSTVNQWLAAHELPQRVVFCCYGEDDYQLYRAALDADLGGAG